jgi:hypothetical protein
MKTFIYWAFGIITDLILLGLFYAWKGVGIQNAGDVVIFWMWSLTVITLLVAFLGDKTMFEDKPRPPGFVWYHGASEVVFISILVWFGFVWLPAVRLVASILLEGARKRESKAKEVQA